MKTNIITTILAAAALLASSCSKEETTEAVQAAQGNRVVFTLGGSTRASGNNDNHTTLAATDNEKKINSLLAVVFGEDGLYYKTFETDYQAANQTASFDIEKNGTYDIWFVANADEDLSTALKTLTDQNTDSQVKADDLQALIASQPVGKNSSLDAWEPFLMLSTQACHITSKHGTVTNGGVVMMRRLAVRIDLVNAAEGVEITSVKFINRTKQSRLGASNDMNFSTTGDLYETKTYDNINLVGNFDTPTEYKETIYSYENVDVTPDDEHLPALEIAYTLDGLKFTHTVKFMDSSDEEGKLPLALKRNYLYRIVLTKPLDVTFNITVDDWNTAEAFQIDELPFEKHDQAALNAKLKVNMFTEYNVKTLAPKDPDTPKGDWTVTFESTLNDNPETTSYFSYTWLAGQDTEGTTSANGSNSTDLREKIFTDADGNQYRMPTGGECMLLIPEQTVNEKDERQHPYWDDNPSSNPTGVVMSTDEFTETVYLENNDEFEANETGNSIIGQSQLKVGKQTEQVTYLDDEVITANVYPVYGIRFKGTSEYAAYRWENCRILDNPLERYFSIKIKALPADSELTVDDITDNVSFWHDGYIEFKIPASGIIDPSEQNVVKWSGYKNFFNSSTLEKDNPARSMRIGINPQNAHTSVTEITWSMPLRLVKVSE